MNIFKLHFLAFSNIFLMIWKLKKLNKCQYFHCHTKFTENNARSISVWFFFYQRIELEKKTWVNFTFVQHFSFSSQQYCSFVRFIWENEERKNRWNLTKKIKFKIIHIFDFLNFAEHLGELNTKNGKFLKFEQFKNNIQYLMQNDVECVEREKNYARKFLSFYIIFTVRRSAVKIFDHFVGRISNPKQFEIYFFTLS